MSREKQITKWQKALTDLGLIGSDDKVEDYLVANWAAMSFLIFGSWRRGTLIFTKKKIVFMTSLGISQIAIDYSDVREAKKCFVGLIPMGMQVTSYDKKTDKMKKNKFWLASRSKWIQKIREKAGITN